MVQRGVRLTRREPKHRLFDLTNSLLIYGKIETTFARAKELAVYIERLIEKAKNPHLASRRDLLRFLGKKQTQKLLEEIAPRFRNIKGGYTRIRRTIQRRGDAALMSTIEILEGEKVEIKNLKLKVSAKGGSASGGKNEGKRKKSKRPPAKSATKSARPADDSKRRRSASKTKAGHHH